MKITSEQPPNGRHADNAAQCSKASTPEPTQRSDEAHAESRIQDLAIVLERLWMFYEAMKYGKPVKDADEMLAQVGTAIRNATKTRKTSELG